LRGAVLILTQVVTLLAVGVNWLYSISIIALISLANTNYTDKEKDKSITKIIAAWIVAIIKPACARPLPLWLGSFFSWLSANGLKIKASGVNVRLSTNPVIANPFQDSTFVSVVISFLKLVGVSSLYTYSGVLFVFSYSGD
jgi:hypothetical protein